MESDRDYNFLTMVKLFSGMAKKFSIPKTTNSLPSPWGTYCLCPEGIV